MLPTVNIHVFNNDLHTCILPQKVAPRIKERMMKEGSMMVTYQSLRDQPNFFRLVLQNSGTDRADMDYFVREFERLGSDL
jgi:glutamate decarboxylase